MQISCAPQGIISLRHPKQGIIDVTEAGFTHILLNLAIPCSPGSLEQIGKSRREKPRQEEEARIIEQPERLYENMKPLLEQCAAKRLQCSIARAPYLIRDTKRDDLNEVIGQLAEECIRICQQEGCRFLIVQPMFAGIPEEDIWECNRDYYLELAAYARQTDVQILIENQCRNLNGHLVRGICSDGAVAAEWIDMLNGQEGEERFGFCMDVGVCNLCGQNMYDFVSELGGRLKAVILRDCDGNSESALLPFTGVKGGTPQTDWLNLIRGLRETGFDGELVIDFHDTAAAFSPILRPELVRMAKSVADYFEWQIGIENLLRKYPSRVLFGAGNMCRNYMKCYGEAYPPLYTCDNNRKLWETEFCGLTVKPPEALRDLPADCAVFICNIYYREIEAQLRQMGIPNPIEFFNDEYMPSFYFDRLDVMER